MPWGLQHLQHLLCWAPRRRKDSSGTSAEGSGKRTRRRSRRHRHGKAGSNLAPLRVTLSDAASGAAGGISPLSDGRMSSALSDSEYHDALEDWSDLGSRGSLDGSHTLGSPPASGSHDGQHPHNQQQQQQQHGGLAERIALWWEGRRATNHTTTTGHEEAATPRGGGPGPLTPRSPLSPALSGVPPEELLEPSPESLKSGCIHLFSHGAHGLAHKKYVRLSKPRAGSSFRDGEQQQGGAAPAPAGPAASPASPPPPPMTPSHSGVVGKLLTRLSPLGRLSPRLPHIELPSSPGPFIKRLLSGGSFSKKDRRKTAEERDAVAAAAWEPADGSTFQVRSLNYMRTKVKEPSGPCIYQLMGVDVYSFDFKIYHIAQHVQLPEAPVLGPAAQALPRDQQLPPLLIINLQLPWYPASLFGSNDGFGHSLVYYFALPEGWEPSQVENPAALGLVQRFMHNKREFDGTPSRDRFKLIPRIVNVQEWAEKGPLSGYEHRLLMNYNDKPLLTRPQQRFYTGPNYLEIDMDVHNYAYIARKAFHGFIHRLAPVVFENAFVVQGNRPEELPEQVLAAARVYRTNFENAKPFPARSLDELGNGTGPGHDGEALR